MLQGARTIAQPDDERPRCLAPRDIGIGFALIAQDFFDNPRQPLGTFAEHTLGGADEIVTVVSGLRTGGERRGGGAVVSFAASPGALATGADLSRGGASVGGESLGCASDERSGGLSAVPRSPGNGDAYCCVTVLGSIDRMSARLRCCDQRCQRQHHRHHAHRRFPQKPVDVRLSATCRCNESRDDPNRIRASPLTNTKVDCPIGARYRFGLAASWRRG